MDVQRAVTTGLEQRLRQEQAVSRNHQRIRARRTHLLYFRRVLQAQRLQNREVMRGRVALYCALRGVQAPAGGTVGLRENQGDLVAGGHQGRQRPFSELGGAGED
jgi:hypothetical protein